MSRVTSPLSPLAKAVLEGHRKEPDRPQFLISILGSMFQPESLDRLVAAYQELAAAGQVEEAGVAKFFDRFLPFYKLAKAEDTAGEEKR